MTDLRTQLDAAMGDPPRSTVDVDAIVRRQRRGARLRIAGAGGATAAVLAGALAGAVALTGAPGPAAPPAAAPTPPSTRSAATPACPGVSPPPPSPSASGAPTTAPADPGHVPLPAGAERRLSTALTSAVRAEIGRAELYPFDDEGITRAPLRFFGGPCDPEPRFRNEYTAVAMFGTRTTSPLMAVYVQTDPRSACTDDRACKVTTGPAGEVIRSITAHGDFQGRVQTRALVAISKRDGTTVQLFASTPGRSSTRPPLSVAQLTRIGLAPGLTLDR